MATEIFRWSTDIFNDAFSIVSTFRTVAFGLTSIVVTTWTSLTAPVSDGSIRTSSTPGNVRSCRSASANGNTLPAIRDEAVCDNGLPGAVRATVIR
ncbi:MAG: hypothetical protein M3Y05_01245 [Gemmatimonadota bacterium]|nr:hypothetical protein [Gemmatimonadota bacterium]